LDAVTTRPAARVKAARVPIEADFQWPTGARSIYFRDPAGNCLEFKAFRDPQAVFERG